MSDPQSARHPLGVSPSCLSGLRAADHSVRQGLPMSGEPRTAAGRALLDELGDAQYVTDPEHDECATFAGLAVPTIEAEARQQALAEVRAGVDALLEETGEPGYAASPDYWVGEDSGKRAILSLLDRLSEKG